MDVKEDTTIRELKAMVAGITRQSVEDMQLAFEEKVLSDDNKMVDYNLNQVTSRATHPAVIYLTFKRKLEFVAC